MPTHSERSTSTPSRGVKVSGDALVRARLSKGWTLRRLAAECAKRGQVVGPDQISRYERGLSTPRPPALLVLAAALGVEVADLLVTPEPEPVGT